MSIIDTLTDDTLDAASEGLAAMLVLLATAGIDPREHMTPRAWEGLRAVAMAGTMDRQPASIAGAHDDDFARAAAGGN